MLVNSSDIRVYELEVTCTPSTTQAEILFSAPTMQSVVQEIPIVSPCYHSILGYFYKMIIGHLDKLLSVFGVSCINHYSHFKL